MERLRGLRGFVQKLGGGDGGGETIRTREQTEEILENLPLTRAFVEQLPRKLILQTAASNDTKATEALHLIKRIDDLITSHATTARDLRDHVSQITTLTTNLSAANTHAARLHTQLLDLTSTIAALEASQTAAELRDLQVAEDARFESYARRRRREVARRREGYEGQLEAFVSERIALGGWGECVDERLDEFLREGEGDGGGSEEILEKEAPRVQGKAQRAAQSIVMQDEDIEDSEELKKWY